MFNLVTKINLFENDIWILKIFNHIIDRLKRFNVISDFKFQQLF
jgi:hypothetical protein